MKVSIVTAVYNREKVIKRALKSVQRQSYADVEHIIQDGASTDATLRIIEKCSKINTLLQSAPDNGIYDAINKGIKRSSGEIVGLLHSDDFLSSDTVIEAIVERFRDPNIDGVYGDLQYVSYADDSKVIRNWKSGEYIRGNLRSGWMPPHPTLYLRREIYERLGTYNLDYKISADYEAVIRYLQAGINLSYIPSVLIKMQSGGVSNNSLRNLIRKSYEDYCALRSNKIGGFGTLTRKNLLKIGQFINR